MTGSKTSIEPYSDHNFHYVHIYSILITADGFVGVFAYLMPHFQENLSDIFPCLLKRSLKDVPVKINLKIEDNIQMYPLLKNLQLQFLLTVIPVKH